MNESESEELLMNLTSGSQRWWLNDADVFIRH